MKKLTIYISFIAILMGFIAKDTYRIVKNESFKRGESIEYLLHYGVLNAGVATVDVSNKLYLLNNRVCYKIDVYGKSIGALDAATRIRDVWRSYIDTASISSHRFYRNIEEGPYRKEETIHINMASKTAKIEDEKPVRTVKTPAHVQDIVSGYYYLRTINFESMKEGEIINIPVLFEDTNYDFKIRYKGRTEVDTKFGKIKAFLAVPIMPDNKLFKGDDAIKVWISDDKNKIPVKVEVELVIGSVSMELKNYKNLKYPFNFIKK